MNCIYCSKHCRVADVRALVSGVVSRRRYCANGHQFTTHEVPAAVLTAVGRSQVARHLDRVRRGAVARVVTKARRALIDSYLAQGWKPTAIAQEVGCTEDRVRQIRRENNSD